MNILICAGIFPPDVGGPASYGQKLALAMQKRGHQVTVVTYSDKKKVDDYYPFPVIRILRSRFKPWHYLRYFLAIFRHGLGADVLYAQDQVSAVYPTYLASKILRKPFAIKVTGDYSWEQAMNRGFTNVPIDEFQSLKTFTPIIEKIRTVQMKVVKGAKKIVAPSEYLKRADLFVLNTGYEGLSNTLVEVLSVGVPIITTNVCGNPEVLENGKNGILVEYNNSEQLKEAIIKVYNDQTLRETFVKNGMQSLEKFSFERMIDETEKFLKD